MSRQIWKSFIAVVLKAVVFTTSSSVVNAEGRTAKDYMAKGIRAAYDNMQLFYQAYYDDEGNLETQPEGYVAIFQEWDDDQLISRTYLGPDGEPINGAEGYARVEWKTDENSVWYVEFYDSKGNTVPLEGINLATNIEESSDSWSDWMTPKYDVENSTFTIGSVILGKKQIGDSYTCLFEIEFRNVTATEGTEEQKFNFRTRGTTDGQWVSANIWNGSLIYLDEPVENSTKKCVATVTLNEIGANTSRFDLGFRCDNWASGEFRIRNVRIEKCE